MRRVPLVLAFLCSVVLVTAACGGDGGGQQATSEPEPTTTSEATETAKRIPQPGEPLSAGSRYHTTKFVPALSFRIVDEGWEVIGAEIPDLMDIAQLEPLVLIIFQNPQKVYDPKRPVERVAMPEPKDWVAWYQNHPYLDTGKPVPVTVGGVSGVQFDTAIHSAPRDSSKSCGAPCIPLYPTSDGASVDFYLDDSVRDTTIILEVGGETVIIGVSIPKDKFEELRPKVQKVLDTVEWESLS